MDGADGACGRGIIVTRKRWVQFFVEIAPPVEKLWASASAARSGGGALKLKYATAPYPRYLKEKR